MDQIEAKKAVIETIRRRHSGENAEMSFDTDLAGDLGIDGDDAIEIFKSLATQFSIDFSGIEWDRHFGPEAGCSPLAFLSPKYAAWHRCRIPVTIRDLVNATVTKEWTMSYTGQAEPDGTRESPS